LKKCWVCGRTYKDLVKIFGKVGPFDKEENAFITINLDWTIDVCYICYNVIGFIWCENFDDELERGDSNLNSWLKHSLRDLFQECFEK